MDETKETPKFTGPYIDLGDVKNKPAPVLIESPSAASSPQPNSAKPSSKVNCLCSPTTHVGSFRCRFHRNSMTRGHSVGSNLSEYGKSATGDDDSFPED